VRTTKHPAGEIRSQVQIGDRAPPLLISAWPGAPGCGVGAEDQALQPEAGVRAGAAPGRLEKGLVALSGARATSPGARQSSEREVRLHRSLPGFELESLHRVSRLEGFEAIKSDRAAVPGRGRTPSLPGRLEATDPAGPEHLVVSHDLDVAVLGNLPLEDPAAGQGAQFRALDPDQHSGLALSDKPVSSLCHPRSIADEN